jgi:hypothetical protein
MATCAQLQRDIRDIELQIRDAKRIEPEWARELTEALREKRVEYARSCSQTMTVDERRVWRDLCRCTGASAGVLARSQKRSEEEVLRTLRSLKGKGLVDSVVRRASGRTVWRAKRKRGR